MGETRTPIPAAPGQPERVNDYEYVRNGVANLFLFFEPLAGGGGGEGHGAAHHGGLGGSGSGNWWTCSIRKRRRSCWCWTT